MRHATPFHCRPATGGRRGCSACGAVHPGSALPPERPAVVAERLCPARGHSAGVRRFGRVVGARRKGGAP